ncbi:MAG: polyphosphate kinase 2 family protein, partial [Actinomycetota bacterium]
MSAAASVGELMGADPGKGAILPGIDPRATPGVEDRDAAEADMASLAERLDELQERLWVEGTRSLLVVLQGMDTSGKGGTVRHVFSAMNPAGLEVASFKKPTEEELAHHFLWRI